MKQEQKDFDLKTAKANKDDGKGDLDSQIGSVLSKSPSSKMPKSQRILLSLVAGLGAALLGGLLWYVVAALFQIQLGYIAIIIGLAVGFSMKFVLKEINMFVLGIAAALFSILGIIIGSFFVWYFQTPVWFRETVVSEYGMSDNEAMVYFSDDLIRSEITFGMYMESDLFSSKEGRTPFVSWLFYILALYVGFSRVYSFKKKGSI